MTALAQLAVGVAQPDGGSSWYATSFGFTTTTVASNGMRSQMNNFQLDGMDNIYPGRNVAALYPNPDAIQEFSYITGQYSAESGRFAGGSLNAITKSGTNELHGSIFGFTRQHNLNARNFFSQADDGLQRNQFGYAVGGPLYIPKVWDARNKAFWFSSFQHQSDRYNSSSTPVFGPTQAEAGGDWTDYLTGQTAQVPSPACDGSTLTVDTGAVFDPTTANAACASPGYPFDPKYPAPEPPP